MKSTRKKIQHTIVITFLLLLSSHIHSETLEIFDNVETTCKQSISEKLLRCEYRLVNPEPVLAVSARFKNESIPVKEQTGYPWKDAVTAILLLVDTSDPARAKVIEQNNQHISRILDKAKKFHRIGLASFDKTLRLEVPIGLSSEQILNAAARLRATGQTTELYRSVLSAIELLDKVDADRKSIYLFSDGLAEDRAYFHEDVVAAARKTGVVITSFGYPRSVSQSVALQTLRRLSEETGGLYIEAENDYNLPDNVLANPFESIDNGGKFTVDLSPLKLLTNTANQLDLLFETDTGEYKKSIPLSVISVATPAEAAVQKTIAKKPEAVTPAPPQEIRVITTESPETSINMWFWFGIPIFLIILLIIAIAALVLVNFRHNKKRDRSVAQGTSEYKPYAYLIIQDETKKRYAITRTTWRIGRGKDNEMILNDSSVSRRHAEIHRDKGDVFTVYDLGSLNGVYVNNTKISSHRLHEGDIIEIGDINIRFTVLSTDYAIEEATAMQNTRAPTTH